MEDTKRRIIAGFAVFTLLFLSGIFAFVLIRIDMLTVNNKDYVKPKLERLKTELENKFSENGKLTNDELSGLITDKMNQEPRLLVVALTKSELEAVEIVKVVAKSKDYLVNADLGKTARDIEYKKPLGTAEFSLPFTLRYKDSEVGLPARISALYTNFAVGDTQTLVWELLFIFLGFIALTLVMIIVTSVIAARTARITAAAVARPDMEAPAEEVDLPEVPARLQRPPSPRPDARAEAVPELVEPAASGLEWSEEEREERKKERLSGETGLVKPEYFRERLANEIERAVSFNEDLALLFIAAPADLAEGFPWQERFVPAVGKLFGDPEAAFQYDERTAAVVAPGMTIDTAIKAAKLLYKHLASGGSRAAFGITARNGRTITPSLFIEEASQAAAQAESGGQSAIIAFRADADKYNDHVISG